LNLFELSEEDFLRRLEDDMAITGDLGELFPRMVAYNVPYFVLSQYWPEERTNLLKDPLFPAFCVAEAEWKGRLENLKGSLDLSSGRLTCEKTYVMQCDVMYVLVWAGEDLALCRVPRNASQTWSRNGRVVDTWYRPDPSKFNRRRTRVSLVTRFFSDTRSFISLSL
jgi:hypothetical protein